MSAVLGTGRLMGAMRRQCLQKQWTTLVRYYGSTCPLLSSDYPPHTIFPMPALSPTMETGTIASWALKEGDEFAAGDILCSIETDKATMDFESQDDGILAKILREGENARDLSVGVPICVVVDEAEDVAAFADYQAQETAAPAAATPESAAPAPSAETTTPASPDVPDRTVDSDFVLMPAARHLSQSKGLDATILAGSGKGGRVTKGDVLQAIASGTPMPALAAATSTASTAPAASVAPTTAAPAAVVEPVIPEVNTEGGYEDVPNNNMRKVIARRLTESKRDVPHYYTSMEVELDEVLALRKRLVKNHDVKVSVNDLIIRSSALALRDVPEVNATYDPKSDSVQLQKTVDVSVAVATPTGLITPIVPNTDQLGLAQITDTVKDLAGRAREGKLQPHEYQGGTFTISNLGMFGIDEFSAVINPPQAAILAIGRSSPKIVPTPYDETKEEQDPPKIQTVMMARLSADRRVVDEATAALFLQAFAHYFSEPELLLL